MYQLNINHWWTRWHLLRREQSTCRPKYVDTPDCISNPNERLIDTKSCIFSDCSSIASLKFTKLPWSCSIKQMKRLRQSETCLTSIAPTLTMTTSLRQWRQIHHHLPPHPSCTCLPTGQKIPRSILYTIRGPCLVKRTTGGRGWQM